MADSRGTERARGYSKPGALTDYPNIQSPTVLASIFVYLRMPTILFCDKVPEEHVEEWTVVMLDVERAASIILRLPPTSKADFLTFVISSIRVFVVGCALFLLLVTSLFCGKTSGRSGCMRGGTGSAAWGVRVSHV